MWLATTAGGMSGVSLIFCDQKGSRSREHAWNFRLDGETSNRSLNFAPDGESWRKAATWDEWGIFLNALFQQDPLAITREYRGLRDFQAATGNRFDELVAAEQCPNHKFRHFGEPHVSECEKGCGAVVKWAGARDRVLVDRGHLVNLSDVASVDRWLATA